MKVRDVMSHFVQTCTPETNLATVAMMMWAWMPLVVGAVGLLFADELRKLVVLKVSSSRHQGTGFAQKEVMAHV